MRGAALAILAACGGDDEPRKCELCPVDTPVDDLYDPVMGAGSVDLVAGGFQFVEGPQWRGSELLFSDIPANTIFTYTPGGPAPTAFRMPSGNSNGLALGGGLIAAEHGTRSVTRDGVPTVSFFEDKRLNSPNDVIVAADGTIYFTDPPFGIQDSQRELDFIGVFRLAGTALTVEHRGALAERPNGIGISPDATRLYVDDSADGNLYRYPILADGALGPRELHATTAGTPDGLAIDFAGNIFVATVSGIEVFSRDGTRRGAIGVPEQPSNCAFGDDDGRTLYITARTSLYKVRLVHPGLPTN